MVLQVLEDLRYEIGRLYMAGSKFAVGDPRIAKIGRQLKELGAKSPVMNKLSELCDALTSSPAAETPESLSNLFALLSAVLRTQCSAELPEEFVAADGCSGLDPQNTPYKRSELIEIMTAFSGKDRTLTDKIREMLDTDIKYDFRLYPYYSLALGHKSHETAFKAVLAAGERIIPYLVRDFDIGGGAGDARRLAALNLLGYTSAKELALKIVNEGASTELTVCAVNILGDDAINEMLILALADDKKQEIREAAFIALAKLNSGEGKQKMLAMLKTKKYACAVKAAALVKETSFTLSVLNIVKDYYGIALDDNKKSADFEAILPSLAGKCNPEVLSFYKLMTEKAQTLGFSKSTNWSNGASFAAMLENVAQADAKPAAEFFGYFSKSPLAASSVGWQGLYLRVMLSAPEIFSKESVYHTLGKEYRAGRFDIDIAATNLLMLDEKWYELFYEKQEYGLMTVLLRNFNLLSPKAGKKLKLAVLDCVSVFNYKSHKFHYYHKMLFELIPLCDDKERRAAASNFLSAVSGIKENSAYFYISGNFNAIYKLLYSDKEMLEKVKKVLSKTDSAKDRFLHTALKEIISQAESV